LYHPALGILIGVFPSAVVPADIVGWGTGKIFPLIYDTLWITLGERKTIVLGIEE
jgi:hypothetical protein